MSFHSGPSVTLLCPSALDQVSHSNVLQPMTKCHTVMSCPPIISYLYVCLFLAAKTWLITLNITLCCDHFTATIWLESHLQPLYFTLKYFVETYKRTKFLFKLLWRSNRVSMWGNEHLYLIMYWRIYKNNLKWCPPRKTLLNEIIIL